MNRYTQEDRDAAIAALNRGQVLDSAQLQAIAEQSGNLMDHFSTPKHEYYRGSNGEWVKFSGRNGRPITREVMAEIVRAFKALGFLALLGFAAHLLGLL